MIFYILLQVLAACFGALSHGSNDVGNCIGPLVTIWHIYRSPIHYNNDTPVYGVLAWGGLGIALGLVCLGERWRLEPLTVSTPVRSTARLQTI